MRRARGAEPRPEIPGQFRHGDVIVGLRVFICGIAERATAGPGPVANATALDVALVVQPRPPGGTDATMSWGGEGDVAWRQRPEDPLSFSLLYFTERGFWAI